jgi:hypothetical protein
MSERIICGYKPASIGSNPARWPRGTTIRYRVAVPQLNGLTRYAFRSAFRWACDRWQDVCGIMFEEVNSRENLTVTIMGGRPGGVLAQAELPYLEGRRTPLMMQFDAFEAVAADAIDQARVNGDLTRLQFRQLFRAIKEQPAIRDELRGQFAKTLTAEQLAAATTLDAKLDFDALFESLAEFFPKLAKAQKFAGLLRRIMGA